MPKAKTTKKSETATETTAEPADRVQYEIMAIIEPDVTEAQYKKHFESLKKMITDLGGSITHEDEWGKRELAYTIKKQDYGYYVVVNFEGDSDKVVELNNQLRITTFVLRHLVIKTPEGYTPQKFDWDEEEETEKKEEPKPKREKKVATPPPPPPAKEEEPEEEKEEPVEKEAPVEEEKSEPVEEPAEEVAEEAEEPEPEPEAAEEPAKEAPAEPEPEPEPETKPAPEPEPEPEEEDDSDMVTDDSDRLSKLDAKLEELLSDDDDLNL